MKTKKAMKASLTSKLLTFDTYCTFKSGKKTLFPSLPSTNQTKQSKKNKKIENKPPFLKRKIPSPPYIGTKS